MLITLTKGMFATIDDEDFDKVSPYTWFCKPSRGTFYAVTSMKRKHIFMHRLILSVPEGFEADHVNGDGLDNRKSNLRVATRTQNLFNRRKFSKKTSSQYKGVYRHPNGWMAYVQVSGKKKYLGLHAEEVNAARIYDAAARLLYGEFAKTNFKEAPHDV